MIPVLWVPHGYGYGAQFQTQDSTNCLHLLTRGAACVARLARAHATLEWFQCHKISVWFIQAKVMTTLWEVWLTCWYATTCYTNSQCTIALYMKLKSYAYQIIKVPPKKRWLMGCHKSRHSKTLNQRCQWTILPSHLYCAWNNSCTKEPGAGSGEPSGGFSSSCIEGWWKIRRQKHICYWQTAQLTKLESS